ncbi:MAG: hypothetical protein R2741_09930 [Methanolobus sp.]
MKNSLRLLKIATGMVVAFVLVILYYIISNGFSALSLEFITEMPRRRMTEGGIYPL